MKDIELNWRDWQLRFFKEAQVYYSLFPVVWQPNFLRKTGLLFEFLRFRMVIQRTHKTKCAKCGCWKYIYVKYVGDKWVNTNGLCDDCFKESK